MNETQGTAAETQIAPFATSDQWDAAVDLLKEVMEWHRDPDSPDYNECDKDPCFWCECAAKAIDPKSASKMTAMRLNEQV